MNADVNLKEMDILIQNAKGSIMQLMKISGGMQCVDRNCERIMASIKMLELNISDVVEFLDE
jgi:hypothetical protein